MALSMHTYFSCKHKAKMFFAIRLIPLSLDCVALLDQVREGVVGEEDGGQSST